VIDLSSGLSPAALSAIEDLERRIVAADGGRLKLQWNALRHRSGQDVEDVLWWDGEDGRVIGTARVHREDHRAGVYGFVIHPDLQGRGIGRDVLHRMCRTARDAGATVVHLEVATDNDRALNLYTSLGFQPVITEDYYALM
jgi:ribosomal protein S18 acetylase RimI-like enzyme